MSTEEDIAELKEMMAALKQENTSLKTRLSEVEDFAQTHIGMDWGQAGISANSPHPNISIDTGEFGGGRERLDSKGIQILANSGTGQNIAIWGVPELVPSPSAETRPKSYIAFNNDATTTTLKLRSDDGLGNTAQVYTFADDASDSSGFRSDIDNDDTSGQTWVTHKTVNGQSWAVLELLNTTLRLASFAADPAGTSDGDMWYRSDLDVIRFQANGVVASIGGGLLTDPAWAAAGDLVYGTGNDTASILSHPSVAGYYLKSATGPNAPQWSGWLTPSAQSSGFSAAAGFHYRCTNTITATLPSAPAEGSIISIKNVGSGVVTVARGGSDTIHTMASGQTSYTVLPGEAYLNTYAGSGTQWDVT